MPIKLNESEKKYSIFFDCLRSFAILGVLSVHIAQQFPIPKFLSEVMWKGAACVQIFFVMSAYLGCSYFFRTGASTFGYYKKRVLRILPMYYTAVLLSMVYYEVIMNGTKTDIFGLGWLRYFMGINTILPSNYFAHWNNCVGFWAMGCFLVFYALLPFIIKIVNTFSRSLAFFVVCYGAFIVLKLYGMQLLPLEGYSIPEELIKVSPFYQMQYFAIGIITFFAIREQKQNIAIILILLFALLPHRIGEHYMLFALLSSIAILTIKDEQIRITGKHLKLIKFLSKYSYHIYLTHLLAFLGAAYIVAELEIRYYYSAKLIISILLIAILSLCLEYANRLALRIFNRQNALA